MATCFGFIKVIMRPNYNTDKGIPYRVHILLFCGAPGS